MIAIRLNKDINPNWLLQKVQHEINEHRKCNTLEDSILYIDIKTISQVSDELMPKLEYITETINDRGNELSEST